MKKKRGGKKKVRPICLKEIYTYVSIILLYGIFQKNIAFLFFIFIINLSVWKY